ncbi:hypothetical protein ACIBCO_40450 [Streptomyces violascens]|uniref:hypothetical protein n=1 Tax=Streptomyces violascens TaxID=67381 RepID=UPI0037B3C51F
MSLLSQSDLAAFAQQVAALLGPHCRAMPDDRQDAAVRIIDDDGRALVLYQDAAKPERLFITARLPEAAEATGLVVRPVTVAAGCTAAHAAAHIRRRLVPAHGHLLSKHAADVPPAGHTRPPAAHAADAAEAAPAPAAVQARATAALAAVAPPYVPGSCGGWVIGARSSRGRSLPAVWWQAVSHSGADDQPANSERGMLPFLGDALRRAGLATTEPHRGRRVFFALPPAIPKEGRHTAKASVDRPGRWDVVDRYSGAKVRGTGDQDRVAYFVEQLNTEHEVRLSLRVASLDLPGIQVGSAEETRLRLVAVALSRHGFLPYGLDDIDHADVPGFLAVDSSTSPSHVVVYRVLEPWGGTRPAAGQGAPGAGNRYDRDLEAYARCLNDSGHRAQAEGEHVRVRVQLPTTA